MSSSTFSSEIGNNLTAEDIANMFDEVRVNDQSDDANDERPQLTEEPVEASEV